MKQPRFLLWFILFMTIVSLVVDLPKELPVKFKLGPLSVNRTLSAPTINLALGPLAIRKDFSTRLGLDLSGGTHLVLEADMTGITTDDKDRAFTSSVQVVERRGKIFWFFQTPTPKNKKK